MVVPGFVMKIVLLLTAISPRILRRIVAGVLGKAARSRELGAT
jgi:hypothetical protein